MILYVIKHPFSRSYTCFYSHADFNEYIKNSDINPLASFEVKMILYHFLEDCELSPEKIDWNKSIRDLCHSVNNFLKKQNIKTRRVRLV